MGARVGGHGTGAWWMAMVVGNTTLRLFEKPLKYDLDVF